MSFKRNVMLSVIAAALCASAPVFAEDAAPAAAAAAPASAYVKPNFTHESYGGMQVVVPLVSDVPAVRGMKLRNIANSLKAVATWGGIMNVKVVMYAKGVAWLKTPDANEKATLDMLRSKGVQFLVCNNSLMEQGIDFHTLYGVTDADIVPSGFAEVAFLQAQKHYVVDPAF